MPSASRAKPLLISDPAMVRALASPVRQEIVDALQAAGPRTMAQLAQLLARPADALYFHVRQLVRVGLVVERERRKDGRHVAGVYALAGATVKLSYDRPVRRDDIARVVHGAVRLSLRDFDHALGAHEPAAGPVRTLWGGRAKGWLTPAELRELNTLLTRVHAILHSGTPRAGARCMSLGFVLAPARPARRPRAQRHTPGLPSGHHGETT